MKRNISRKAAMLAGGIFALAAASTTVRAAITDGLQLHTPFNSGDGTTVTDVYGTATNGTIGDNTNITQITNPGGVGALQLGDQLSATGSQTSGVSFGNVLDPGTGGYTFSGWFNLSAPLTTNGNYFIAAKSATNASNVPGWQVFANATADGSAGIYVRAASSTTPGTNRIGENITSGISEGAWHQVAFTFTVVGNTTTMTGYLDGSHTGFVAGAKGPTNDTMTGASSPLSVDTAASLLYGLNGSSTNPYKGSLGDFGIWNRTLSADEINSIYQAGLAGHDLESVPEPTTAMLGVGMLGAIALRRQRANVNKEIL